MSVSDILCIDDLSCGWVAFRALNRDETGFLRWLVEDTPHVDIDERTIAVQEDDGDYVYQTLLMNGLVIEFPTGDKIQLPDDAVHDLNRMIEDIKRRRLS